MHAPISWSQHGLPDVARVKADAKTEEGATEELFETSSPVTAPYLRRRQVGRGMSMSSKSSSSWLERYQMNITWWFENRPPRPDWRCTRWTAPQRSRKPEPQCGEAGRETKACLSSTLNLGKVWTVFVPYVVSIVFVNLCKTRISGLFRSFIFLKITIDFWWTMRDDLAIVQHP